MNGDEPGRETAAPLAASDVAARLAELRDLLRLTASLQAAAAKAGERLLPPREPGP
ncbi:MAG: hypothetical protein FJ087_10670 [Deltaproteobacteria bacterium]|nr:hypothetical protein [Deltaproteobacteria bacterium]